MKYILLNKIRTVLSIYNQRKFTKQKNVDIQLPGFDMSLKLKYLIFLKVSVQTCR